jgi:hypothetical protein
MRKSSNRAMIDTEPYQEWLAVLGSLFVVGMGLIILFAQGAFGLI